MYKIDNTGTYVIKEQTIENELFHIHINKTDHLDLWQEYQDWVAEGNVAELIESPLDKARRETRISLMNDLARVDTTLLKLIIKIYQKLNADGLISKADIGEALVDEAQALRQKLQELDALDTD